MLSSSIRFAKNFLSSMRKEPEIVGIANMLLNDSAVTKTDFFFSAFSLWAREYMETAPDPTLDNFLKEIEVTCVMHNKMATSPEHEFLILETKHRETGAVRPLILERTIEDQDPKASTAEKSPGEAYNRLLNTIRSMASAPSSIASMEEGHSSSSSLSSLSNVDKLTVVSTQVADVLSRSTELSDKFTACDANDQFLGQKFVFDSKWHGENVRHFKPKNRLSLYEVALLANLVHKEFPKYNLLTVQCFFYADLVYRALEHRFGSQSGSSENVKENQDDLKVHIDNSVLSDKFGRYKGALLSKMAPKVVEDIVEKFTAAYAVEIVQVI
jgi:hypothetical protein